MYQLFTLDAHLEHSLFVQFEIGILMFHCFCLNKIGGTFSRGRAKLGVK